MKKDDVQYIQAYEVKHNRNYPVICKDDSVIVDTRINTYKEEGWYLYMDDFYKVSLSPKFSGVGVVLYQLNGEQMELKFEDFHPFGRVNGVQRAEI